MLLATALLSPCSSGHCEVPLRLCRLLMHRLHPLILARVPPVLPSNLFLLSFASSKTTALTHWVCYIPERGQYQALHRPGSHLLHR